MAEISLEIFRSVVWIGAILWLSWVIWSQIARVVTARQPSWYLAYREWLTQSSWTQRALSKSAIALLILIALDVAEWLGGVFHVLGLATFPFEWAATLIAAPFAVAGCFIQERFSKRKPRDFLFGNRRSDS